MDARTLLIIVVALLGGGYLVYGRFVARLVGIDPSRPTPAHTKYDGVDYVPAPQWQVLFGHHFSSICAAGPIVGPALAVAYWGWAPSIVWIVLGGRPHGGGGGLHLAGGRGAPRRRLHRRGLGASDHPTSSDSLLRLHPDRPGPGPRGLRGAHCRHLRPGPGDRGPELGHPAGGGGWPASLLYRGRSGGSRLALVTVLGLGAIVGLLALGHAFPPSVPEVAGLTPQTFWILVLLVYCFVASILPVQYLLQPRDYLSSYVLFTTIGLGLVGILATGPELPGRALPRLRARGLAPGRTAVAPHVRDHRVRRDLGLSLGGVLGDHVQAARQRGPRLPHRLRCDDHGIHRGHPGGDRGGRRAERDPPRRAPAGPPGEPSPRSAKATACSPARCSGPTGRRSPSWRSTSSS